MSWIFHKQLQDVCNYSFIFVQYLQIENSYIPNPWCHIVMCSLQVPRYVPSQPRRNSPCTQLIFSSQFTNTHSICLTWWKYSKNNTFNQNCGCTAVVLALILTQGRLLCDQVSSYFELWSLCGTHAIILLDIFCENWVARYRISHRYTGDIPERLQLCLADLESLLLRSNMINKVIPK